MTDDLQPPQSRPESREEEYYRIISDESFDLTPFVDLANELRKMAESGQVNNMRRRLVLFYANLIRRAKLTAAIGELKNDTFEYSDDYDIRYHVSRRLATLTAQLTALEET